MSKWAYMCCELDLHHYNNEELIDIYEWNDNAEKENLPKYKLFDTKKQAMHDIAPTPNIIKKGK